jgi:NHS family nucleoside permease-like MFS transporter
MLMTNGLGATIGSYAAQWVVNIHTVDGVTNWQPCWYTFAGYALVVGIVFALVFRPRKEDVSAD